MTNDKVLQTMSVRRNGRLEQTINYGSVPTPSIESLESWLGAPAQVEMVDHEKTIVRLHKPRSCYEHWYYIYDQPINPS